MPTLIEKLDAQVAGLEAEKDRILTQAKADVADVDLKIGALQSARGTLSPDVEKSYALLRRLGLIKEI